MSVPLYLLAGSSITHTTPFSVSHARTRTLSLSNSLESMRTEQNDTYAAFTDQQGTRRKKKKKQECLAKMRYEHRTNKLDKTRHHETQYSTILPRAHSFFGPAIHSQLEHSVVCRKHFPILCRCQSHLYFIEVMTTIVLHLILLSHLAIDAWQNEITGEGVGNEHKISAFLEWRRKWKYSLDARTECCANVLAIVEHTQLSQAFSFGLFPAKYTRLFVSSAYSSSTQSVDVLMLTVESREIITTCIAPETETAGEWKRDINHIHRVAHSNSHTITHTHTHMHGPSWVIAHVCVPNEPIAVW